MTKTQTRGICQCCGRDHAVLAFGRMSKHGYTVKNGWFNGVCSGHRHLPLQIERTVTDSIIQSVRRDCDRLDQVAVDLKSGKTHPNEAANGKRDNRGHAILCPFAEAAPWHQKEAVRFAIWNAEQRAQLGRSFADGMEKLAERIYGTELRVVPVTEGPAPILCGETRTLSSCRTATVTRVERGRVYWKDERGFNGWSGTPAWRKLPLVAE